jgi:mannose-6-phosphate isomerase-like protein (cupin superfamily)
VRIGADDEINEEERVIPEARLERLASGLAPVTPGWFVVNTADAAWVNNESYGGVCIFESDGVVLQDRPDLTEYEKPNAGFTIRVVPPGQPGVLYHAESVQEDFLVLMGECLLIIEDQERHLRAWDFVHCPPMTSHAFVAKETGPCVILATGNRRDDLERVHRRSEVALRYDAGTAVDMTEPERRGRWEVRHPEHWDELPWAERR